MACKFPLCSSHAPGGCIMCPERPPETAVFRKEPYAEQREAEAVESPSLADKANHLEEMAIALQAGPKSRSVSIAITHLQEAAMWLNRAHYKKD